MVYPDAIHPLLTGVEEAHCLPVYVEGHARVPSVCILVIPAAQVHVSVRTSSVPCKATALSACQFSLCQAVLNAQSCWTMQ